MSSRFDRLAALPEVGEPGTERLRQARVAIVGMGGLGVSVAATLGAAGVGQLTLLDDGIIDEPDLGRQFLYSSGDIGRLKVEAASEALRRQNPSLRVDSIAERVLLRAGQEHLAEHHVIIDGTDSLGARRVLNGIGIRLGVPVVFGGAVGWSGFVQAVLPGSACYDCVWTDRTICGSCEEVGVAGPLVAAIGSLQAAEAMKIIFGIGDALAGRLLLLDVFRGSARCVDVRRRPECQACGTSN